MGFGISTITKTLTFYMSCFKVISTVLIKVDTDRVFLYGKSQGTCFLNRFVSRWGSYYGGGLLADCGCSEGLDPLLRANPDDLARMRVFVRAPTGDFLHNLSRQAYGYYKYVVGLGHKEVI